MTAATTYEELRWACATHNRAGRHEEALACAEEAWRPFPEQRHYSWWLVVQANVALGRLSDAVDALEAAEAENRLWRLGVLRGPALEPLGPLHHPNSRPTAPRPRALRPGQPLAVLAPLLLASCTDDVATNCPPLSHPEVLTVAAAAGNPCAARAGESGALLALRVVRT